jgi:hypothetical protein
VDEFGVRRQSEAATALWIDAFGESSKAVSAFRSATALQIYRPLKAGSQSYYDRDPRLESLGYFHQSADVDEFGVRRQSEPSTALWIDAFGESSKAVSALRSATALQIYCWLSGLC